VLVHCVKKKKGGKKSTGIRNHQPKEGKKQTENRFKKGRKTKSETRGGGKVKVGES